jgi:hypothetical protein
LADEFRYQADLDKVDYSWHPGIGGDSWSSCPSVHSRPFLFFDLPTRKILGRRKWQSLKILFYEWFALGLSFFVEPQTMNQIKLAVTIHSHNWTAALGTDSITRRKIPLHGRASFQASAVFTGYTRV